MFLRQQIMQTKLRLASGAHCGSSLRTILGYMRQFTPGSSIACQPCEQQAEAM